MEGREGRFKIVLHHKALKNLVKIPLPLQKRIVKAIDFLADNPFFGEKLWGELFGKRKIKVWPYRIVYQIFEHDKVIYILKIEHRQGVYK